MRLTFITPRAKPVRNEVNEMLPSYLPTRVCPDRETKILKTKGPKFSSIQEVFHTTQGSNHIDPYETTFSKS